MTAYEQTFPTSSPFVLTLLHDLQAVRSDSTACVMLTGAAAAGVGEPALRVSPPAQVGDRHRKSAQVLRKQDQRRDHRQAQLRAGTRIRKWNAWGMAIVGKPSCLHVHKGEEKIMADCRRRPTSMHTRKLTGSVSPCQQARLHAHAQRLEGR